MLTIKYAPTPLWFLVLALMSVISANPVFAKTEVTAKELTTWLQPLIQFQAQFTQTSYDDVGIPKDASSGHMSIVRPGRFRWDYTTPFEQTILADGRQLWIYDIEMEQITVRALDDSIESLPSVLLSGEVAEILEKFDVSQQAFDVPNVNDPESSTGYLELTLVPHRSSDELSKIILTLTLANYQPAELAIYDAYERLTRFVFQNYQTLPESDFGRFIMQIPEGVDVVGQPK